MKYYNLPNILGIMLPPSAEGTLEDAAEPIDNNINPQNDDTVLQISFMPANFYLFTSCV